MLIPGNVCIEVFEELTGKVLQREVVHNIVTTAGLEELARRLVLIVPLQRDMLGVGEGTTAPAITDTGLETELWRDYVSGAEAGSGLAVWRYQLPATAIVGATVTEGGLFSHGVLLSRFTHTGIVKSSGLGINYTYQHSLANA